jgi:hypothetical protein
MGDTARFNLEFRHLFLGGRSGEIAAYQEAPERLIKRADAPREAKAVLKHLGRPRLPRRI